MDISGKRFLIYGAGVSGYAAAVAIKKRGGVAEIFEDENGNFVAPKGGFDAAVVSPGIAFDHAVYTYCAERGIAVTSEVELGFELTDKTVIGVTGTNGKTTVTRLIAAMTTGTACGNIGYALLSAIDDGKKQPLVCELSSFQLARKRLDPTIAVITNITCDHLDRHGSIEAYRKAKCNVAGAHTKALILGDEIPLAALEYLDTDAEIVRCSRRDYTDMCIVGKYFVFRGEKICPVDYLRLRGAHNEMNALTAIAAAKIYGAENVEILRALCSAVSAPHRIERVGRACGKEWINDSKGTNISATLAAVTDTLGNICLIVGGRNKGLDFKELFERLPSRVTTVVATGECGEKIAKAAAERAYKGRLEVTDTLDTAVKTAALSSADTVLLSPACASFDEFENYAERGKAFEKAVKNLDGTQRPE